MQPPPSRNEHRNRLLSWIDRRRCVGCPYAGHGDLLVKEWAGGPETLISVSGRRPPPAASAIRVGIRPCHRQRVLGACRRAYRLTSNGKDKLTMLDAAANAASIELNPGQFLAYRARTVVAIVVEPTRGFFPSCRIFGVAEYSAAERLVLRKPPFSLSRAPSAAGARGRRPNGQPFGAHLRDCESDRTTVGKMIVARSD